MPLKTPQFWYQKTKTAPFVEAALWPLAKLYQFGHTINQKSKNPYKADIPVICIGNAVAGGGGKTPTAIAIKKLIHTRYSEERIFFLTRGYKGNLSGAIMVDELIHTPDDLGDEAFLLARHGRTIKSVDRPAGLKRAQDEKADIVIMDDGLQNNSVHKDLSFMVIDGSNGFGNFKTLPSGPLRESLNIAFQKTDAFILIGSDIRHVRQHLPKEKPLFTAQIKAHHDLKKSEKVIAFCGLAVPEKFKNTLEQEGFDIVGWKTFPDHHMFTPQELDKLIKNANKNNARLITTEKDAIRITDEKIRKQIDVLKIDLVFDDSKSVLAFMKEHLSW